MPLKVEIKNRKILTVKPRSPGFPRKPDAPGGPCIKINYVKYFCGIRS